MKELAEVQTKKASAETMERVTRLKKELGDAEGLTALWTEKVIFPRLISITN